MQCILDRPMFSHQREHAFWWRLRHREATESIDHLLAGLMGLEEAHRAFEPKHLLDAFPLLGKPVAQIRTTKDLAVFQSSMPLRPCLRLSPSSPIWGAIFQQIGDILW